MDVWAKCTPLRQQAVGEGRVYVSASWFRLLATGQRATMGV